MNADEMMHELGFEKVDEYTSEDKVTYQCCTENDYWIVRFFKSYGGIAKYLVAHSHWFETDGDWRKMEVFIDTEMHKAIHQVLLEHGWL